PSSAQPGSGVLELRSDVCVGMGCSVFYYLPSSPNAVPLIVSFASTIVVKSAVSQVTLVNLNSPPAASGANKPPDVYFYDNTVRISWQSLTLHSETDPVSFIIMTGVSSGALLSDRFLSLPPVRSSGFAGKQTDTNADPITTESADAVAVDSSAGGSQPVSS